MENEKVKLRRYEDDLYISGMGVMIMGVWTVIKFGMQLFLETDMGTDPEAVGIDSSLSKGMELLILAVIFVILALLILKLHLYIGLNAVKAAKGKTYKKGYYTAAIIMLVLTLLGFGVYPEMLEDMENIDTNLASMLVDLTTVYILAIVIISTDRIRKLSKTQIQE